MKIKRRFLINMIFFGTTMLVIAVSLVFTERQRGQLDKQEEIAIAIEREASELSYLSNDYLLYQESQQKDRWETKFSSLSSHLHELKVNSLEQEKLVANIEENLQRLEGVFTDVSLIFESEPQDRATSAAVSLIQIPWSRMAVQSQGIIFDALRLVHLFESQAGQLKRTNTILILALLAMFSAYFFINYLIVYRQLLKSIANLRAATKNIESGNLDYTAADQAEDEIGELGSAFGKITAELKNVTTSKTELEKEIEERKRMELALAFSEKKYRDLFDSMAEAFSVVEPLKDEKGNFFDYRFHEVNRSWEKMFGFPQKKTVGTTARELNPKIEPNWIAKLGRVTSTKEPFHLEEYLGRLEKWFEIYAYPVENNLVACIITDVTQRKKAEDELKKNEKWLREVIGAAEAGRYGHATDFSNGFVSEKMASILGFKLAELPTYPEFAPWFANRIHPEDRTGFQAAVENYFEGKIPRFDQEYRFLNKNNQWIWLHVITAPTQHDEKGRPAFSVGLVFDISAHKKTEELLKTEKEFSENILETMPDGMSIVDQDSRIIYLNKNFQEIFGQKTLGQKCYEIFKDDKTQCPLCPLRDTIEIGQTKTIEIAGVVGGRTFSVSHTGISIDGKKHILEFFRDITDQKKSEKIIQDSEEKYRNLYNSIRDGIALADMKGRILECNQTYLSMLGYDQDEIKQITYQEITPEKWRQMEKEIIERRVLEKGYSGIYEKEFRRKDGTVFPVSIQVWLTRDEEGKPKGMWAMVNDITFRKKRQEEIECLIKDLKDEREKRESLLTRIANERDVLDTLMENTGSQLAYMDRDFNFVAVNQSYCQGCGKKEEELLGKNHFRLFPSRENEAIFKKVLETGESVEFLAKPFVFADRPYLGTTYWDWTLTPVRDAKNQIFGLVLSMIDVTERTKTEKDILSYTKKLEQLTSELQRVKLAVENASDLIWIANPKEEIIFINQAAFALLGHQPQELVGKKIFSWKKDLPRDFYHKLWEALKTEKNFSAEVFDVRKDKSIFPTELHIAPVFDRMGKIIFLVGIERDISEAKNLDRAKTEFISLAAHQLRTPISTISLTAEMLMGGLAGKIGPEATKYLADIVEHVQKMTSMIEVFLNISRMELGTFEINPKPVDLIKNIEENLKNVAPLMQAKSLHLKKSFPVASFSLNIDPKITHLALENILSNAVKYTPSNGSIGVSAEIQQDQIVIKISDSGCGIPENQQDQIFQKMFRADNVKDSQIEGTGLGLYAAKMFLSEAGCKIWFESEENKGTTFYLAIPLSGMKEKKRNKKTAE
ncbi:MAG: PAS domain S-box protein [Candidatus Nealsonbacteria bacterium]|nr:PAS domain S-box protein [Candidatus Nealsonbacteria bacterium]